LTAKPDGDTYPAPQFERPAGHVAPISDREGSFE
jgi:hypothetical protein